MTLEAGPEQTGDNTEDPDVDSAEVETVYVDDVDDDELTRILEALLLVVDTPVSAETLGAVTEQPVHRITEILMRMAQELTARDSGIDLREAGGGWRLHRAIGQGDGSRHLLQSPGKG